jgi:putative flippase GtrA
MVRRLKIANMALVGMVVSRATEVLRYLATGALSVALNLLIIVSLTDWAGLHYLASISVCFVTVTLISFCLNRFWTFGKRKPRVSGDLVRYALVTLTQVPLSLGACSLCVEVFHIPYPIAVVFVSIVFTPMTYLLHRSWSFRSTPAAPRLQRTSVE